MRTRRRLLIGLLLTPIPLLSVCLVSGWTILNYDKVGRISDFMPVTNGLQIPGTSYVISYQTSNFDPKITEIQIQNDLPQNALTIGILDYSYNPAYRLLRHKGKLYLIFKQDNGGSAGGFEFNVLDITTNSPRSLLPDDEWTGVSCTYPRLDGDSLEFERSEKCDYIGWPFMRIGRATSSTVPLK